MDRSGAADDFGFVIDLVGQTVTFEGGYTTPITEMLDRRGDETETPADVRFVVVEMPPEGLWVTIDLDDLRRDISYSIH